MYLTAVHVEIIKGTRIEQNSFQNYHFTFVCQEVNMPISPSCQGPEITFFIY